MPFKTAVALVIVAFPSSPPAFTAAVTVILEAAVTIFLCSNSSYSSPVFSSIRLRFLEVASLSSASSIVSEICTAPAYPTNPPAYVPDACTLMESPDTSQPVITDGRKPTRLNNWASADPDRIAVKSFFTISRSLLFASISATSPRSAFPVNPPT